MDILRSRDAFSRPDKLIFILAPLALIVASACAQAAGPDGPGAGTLGNQLRQEKVLVPAPPVNAPLVLPEEGESRKALSSDSHTTVVVKKVVFTGLPDGFSGLSEQVLQEQISDDQNRSLTFAGLEAMVQKVTDLYRHNGLLVARAILPPQTVKDGVLTIEIIPGRYDSEQITNTSALRDSVAQRLVQTTTLVGDVVTRNQLEREALLLSEIPGVNALLAMKAGRQQGTTTPEITLTPGQRFGGYVGLDNQGDPTTGRSRAIAGVYANELLGYGDQLRVDLLDAYEKSNLFNGSVDYSLLAGGYGTRIGANYSHLNYHYNFLQRGFNGYSDNWALYVTHPWIRTAHARVDVRAEGGEQNLTDKYPADLYRGLGEEGRKRVTSGAVSVTGSVADVPGGVSGFSVKGTAGSLDYRNDLARSISFSRELGSAGQFVRMNWTLNHAQQVWGPFSVYAGFSGQMANHNLDSSQKYLLGGPGAVRAYDIGTGSVDNGTVATGEVRWTHAIPQGRWTAWAGASPSVTLAAFYDQGWGEQYAQNRSRSGGGRLTDHNHVNLSGAGLYTTVADAGNYALTLTWAHRTGNADPVSGLDDHDRFWVSAVKTF
ncbi:ShlB/FhaC/HecB family hemolysin secretion/activation protein [Salmonella enterica]|nr:ShlB/FhaC/HecB family hemolysin secretion/activation protein [Salmonella enterica]EEG9157058.1 ShlB/FhaC/HecB family hemolysin secretion/activation protein [Salmonella enterica]